MRIVTVLILLVLGLALYLANAAPEGRAPVVPPVTTTASAGEAPTESAEEREARVRADRERLLDEARNARFDDGLDRRSGFTPDGPSSLDEQLERAAAGEAELGAGSAEESVDAPVDVEAVDAASVERAGAGTSDATVQAVDAGAAPGGAADADVRTGGTPPDAAGAEGDSSVQPGDAVQPG
ncbi:MAG: hypothetical protein AAFP86_21385, partial [Planctomycetota bacterium]